MHVGSSLIRCLEDALATTIRARRGYVGMSGLGGFVVARVHR